MNEKENAAQGAVTKEAWHTPGPWVANTTPALRGTWVVDADDSTNEHVATLYAGPEKANREADARLIAAAPDGYALARYIKARFERIAHNLLPNEQGELGALLLTFLQKVEGR